MPQKIRIGTVPILWNNDDVPELTPAVAADDVLRDMKRAGFDGTELGSNYPASPHELRRLLGLHGLVLSGGYFCTDYTQPARHAQIVKDADKLCVRLSESGAEYLVVADQIHEARSKVAGRAGPQHGQNIEAFRAMVDVLGQICRVAEQRGLKMVFHNHAGTYVETPAELDELMRATDSSMGLCLDTGHYMFGGGDPIDAIKRYAKRLRYVHLKDIDPAAHAKAMQTESSFLDCLRQRVFTEVGQGALDLNGVVSALRDSGYQGWIVCEQDTGHRSPLESATLSARNLRAALSKAGLS